jgi:hypothetical protein
MNRHLVQQKHIANLSWKSQSSRYLIQIRQMSFANTYRDAKFTYRAATLTSQLANLANRAGSLPYRAYSLTQKATNHTYGAANLTYRAANLTLQNIQSLPDPTEHLISLKPMSPSDRPSHQQSGQSHQQNNLTCIP